MPAVRDVSRNSDSQLRRLRPFIDLSKTSLQFFTDTLDVRWPQEIEMPAIDFADFDAAHRAHAPSHFRVANIVKGLPRALEQKNWRPKPGRLEILTWPVGLVPGSFANAAPSNPPLEGSCQGGKLLLS